MSKTIAAHLGIDETAAAALVYKLERLSGFHCEDNRLLAESLGRVRSKIRGLNLDPSDTTPKELYHALQARIADDSEKLSKVAGLTKAKPDVRLQTLINLVELIDLPREVWVPRRSAAKDLLRRQPPRGLMRQLNYRSLESLLKREDIDELLAVADFSESSTWRRNFYRGFIHLKPSDFEIRQSRVITIKAKKWQALESPAAVTASRASGVVALWPEAGRSPSHWLGSFLTVIEAVEALRLESFSLMINQTQPDFSRRLARQMEAGVKPPAFIASQPTSWRTLNHHFGRLPQTLHPVFAEAYIQQIDMHKTSPAAAAAALFPAVRWWSDNDCLGWPKDGGLVSLNPGDALLNHINRSDYRRASHHRLGLAFWDELISRYLHHTGVERFILGQIQSKMVATKPGLQQKYASEFEPELQHA